MIYTSPIESIAWDDVQSFCAQTIAENAFLDYKLDFPDDLARTIAAMANTSGGVILIGVGETVDGRPTVPAVGIARAKGLSERVTNIVIDSITPPVFPEVCVCIDEALDRAIVLIRVPQSPEGPHAKGGSPCEPHGRMWKQQQLVQCSDSRSSPCVSQTV